MNNKGLTLVELIISIALISVIVLFMYRLLSDVNFAKDDDFIATLNMQQRMEIVDDIQELIKENEIKKAALKNNSRNLELQDASGNAVNTIKILNNNTLTVSDRSNNIIYQWTMKGGNFGTSPKMQLSSTTSETYKMYTVIIPIYTTNVDNSTSNNNRLDDIELSFILRQ